MNGLENPFVLAPEEYKRDIDILKLYIQDVVHYLHIQTGQEKDVCRKYVIKQLSPGGRFELIDPVIHYLVRQENGDRKQTQSTLLSYLNDSIKNNEIIAPTFTTYQNPKDNQSILVDFIDTNIALRSKAKKEMFAAEMAGDKYLTALKKQEQGNKKISNNSLSGAQVSNSTPLFNPTAHSSLTSNCRCTSAFGNANNEKFLTGNRHYWNPKIVLNNVVSITRMTDYDLLASVADKYQLHVPSVEETMECITYSSNLYWKNREALEMIERFVSRLSGLQRMSFVYTGDFYHLAKFNDSFIRAFLTRLSTPVIGDCPNAKEILKSHRAEYLTLATQFFPNEMRGRTTKDVENEKVYEHLALTVQNIHREIIEHKDLIRAFFVTKNVPSSLAFFPESIRRSVLTSDTDSTIFTVQDWVFWMYGKDVGFNPQTEAISATMIFMAAETITHILAQMSANFGIESKRIHQIAMKNEFKFDVFVPTQIGKHYYAYIGCQEGHLFKEYKKEIKGVHLKSSNVPKIIINQAEALMTQIMDTILSGKKISMHQILTQVADVEREIKRSILAGESTYFRIVQIKGSDAYKKKQEESPYQYYLFWEEVFASTYGSAPPPPYTGLKIPVQLKNKTAVQEWINKLGNVSIREALKAWFERTNKPSITTFVLPEQVLQVSGMPDEIKEILDLRKIIYDITSVFSIILESIGFYYTNDKQTRLVSDEY